MNKDIILYDSQCKFCISIKNSIEKKDKNSCFQFIAQNSDMGNQYCKDLRLNKKEQNSIIYIKNDRSYLIRSDAVLLILKKIEKYKAIYFTISLFPRFLRDTGYNFVAWFRRFI